MITEKKRLQTLVHPVTHVQYDFLVWDGVPADDSIVEVVRTDRHNRVAYAVPIEEARMLWSRLVKKGYQRF